MSEKTNLTVEQCAQQFELYAKSNPSSDSQHSLKFCAKFLREFCKQSSDTTWVKDAAEEIHRTTILSKEECNKIEQILTRHAKSKV